MNQLDNTKSLKELESELGSYNNDLTSLRGFDPYDYYKYVEENKEYYQATGVDPKMDYARNFLRRTTESYGNTYDYEYGKTLDFNGIVSSLDSLYKMNKDRESREAFLQETEEKAEPADSLFELEGGMLDVDALENSTPLYTPVAKDRFAGRELTIQTRRSKPMFSEIYPEFEFLYHVNFNWKYNTYDRLLAEIDLKKAAAKFSIGESEVNTTDPYILDDVTNIAYPNPNYKDYSYSPTALPIDNQQEDLYKDIALFAPESNTEGIEASKRLNKYILINKTNNVEEAVDSMVDYYGTTSSELLDLSMPDHLLKWVGHFSELDWDNLEPTQELVDYINDEDRVETTEKGKKVARPMTLSGLQYIKAEYDRAKEKQAQKEESTIQIGNATRPLSSTELRIKAQLEEFKTLPASKQDEIIRQYYTALENYNNSTTVNSDEIMYLMDLLIKDKTIGAANKEDIYKYTNDILTKMMVGHYTVQVPQADGTIKVEKVAVNPTAYIEMFDKMAAGMDVYYADNFYRTQVFTGKNKMTDSDKLKRMVEFMVRSELAGQEEAVSHLQSTLPKYEPPAREEHWFFDSGCYKALRRFGKSIYTSGAYLVGALEGTTYAAIDLFGGSTPDAAKDLGFFERWGYYIGNSNVAQHAYSVDSAGAMPWHVAYNDALRYGYDLTNMDGENAFWRFMGDSGFSAAATILSLGTGAVFKAASKKAGKWTAKRVAKEAMTELTKKRIDNIVGHTATILTATSVAAPEALMNATDVYHESKNNGIAFIDKQIKDQVTKDLQQFASSLDLNMSPEELKESLKNSELFKLLSENSTSLKEYEEFYALLNSKEFEEAYRNGTYSDEWIQLQYSSIASKLNQEVQSLSEKWEEQTYSERRKEMEKVVETNAWEAYAGSAALDLLIVTTTDLFLSKALAPTLGSLAKGTVLRPLSKQFGNEMVKTVVDEAGNYAAKSTKYRFASKFLLDVGSEGLEEVGTYASDETAKALAMMDIGNYYNNTYNNETDTMMGLGLWNNFGEASKIFMQSAWSAEGWEVFTQGVYGALFGSVNINSNARVQRDIEYSRATNVFEKAAASVNRVWRSPLFYHISDRRAHIVNSNTAVKAVNEHLKSNPELAKAFTSAEATMSYINGYYKAKQANNQLEMEENEFGMYVAQANMISKLKGTYLGKSFDKKIKELLNATVDSELGQKMADNYINLLDSEDKSSFLENKEAALEEAKKNVRKFAEIQKNVTEHLSKIDDEYNYSIDDRTKEALAYTYMTQDNHKKLLQEREDIIKNALTKKSLYKDKTEASNLTQEEKTAVANYGTYENAVLLYEESKKRGADSYTLGVIKEGMKILKKLKNDGRNTTLNISEILTLTPKERAKFFDGVDRYSAEQTKVVKKFKTSGLGSHTLQAITDAGKIQEKLDMNESILEGLDDSSLNVFKLSNILQANSDLKNAKEKTAFLLDVKTYDEFRNGLDALIDTGKLTVSESALLGTHVFTNGLSKQFYNDYIKGARVAYSNKAIIKGITFKVSNRKVKTIVDAVLDRLASDIRDENTRLDFDKASNLFTNGGFLKTLKDNYNIDWNLIAEPEQHNILQEVKRAIDIANRALSNRADAESRFNQRRYEVPIEERFSYELFDAEKYQKAKVLYDAIFDKVAGIIRGDKVKLSAVDIYQICCLFKKNKLIAPLEVDMKLFKGLNTSLNSVSDIEKMIKELGERNNYSDSYDVYAQFIDGLIRWGQRCFNVSPMEVLGSAIAELNPDFKESLRSKKSEDSKKKRNKGITFNRNVDNFILDIVPYGNHALSETEQEWYDNNNVRENVTYLAKNLNPKDLRIMLVRDPNLYESGAVYDSDTLPLAVCAEVSSSVKNAVKIDGRYVIFLGIADKSRRGVSENENVLNIIRDQMMAADNEVESFIVKYNDSGNPVIFSGWNLTRTEVDGESINTNLTESLLSKYEGKPEGERFEAAFQDFCANTVKVECKPEVKDGIHRLHVTYKWKDPKTKKEDVYEDFLPISEETIEKKRKVGKENNTYTRIAYIEPNKNGGNPIIKFLKYDLRDLEYQGNSIIEIYEKIKKGEINLFVGNYKDTTVDIFASMLHELNSKVFNNDLKNKLKSNKDSDIKAAQEFLDKEIQKCFQFYLNLQRPKGVSARLFYKSAIHDKDVNGVKVRHLTINVKDSSLGDTDNTIHQISMPVEELVSPNSFITNSETGTKIRPLHVMLQNLVFNTILNENSDGSYSYRTYDIKDSEGKVVDTQYTVKMEVNYKNFTGSEGGDFKDARRRVFSTGILRTDPNSSKSVVEGNYSRLVKDQKPEIKTAVKEDGSEVEIVDQKPLDSKELVENALKILNEFRTKGERNTKDTTTTGGTGVTTLIKDDSNSNQGDSTAVDLSLDIGTSFDYVIRRYFEMGMDPVATDDKIRNEFKKHKIDGKSTCPLQGLNYKLMKDFLDKLHNLNEFFSDRREKVFPAELLFRETLKREDGKFVEAVAIPDIVTIDEKGELHIYDIKTYKQIDGVESREGFYDDTKFSVRLGNYMIKASVKGGSWQKQLSLYAHMIEKATGLKVASTGIIPIPLVYKTNGVKKSGDKISGIGKASINEFRNSEDEHFTVDDYTVYRNALKYNILPLSSIDIDWRDNPTAVTGNERFDSNGNLITEQSNTEEDIEQIDNESVEEIVPDINEGIESIGTDDSFSDDFLGDIFGDDFSIDDVGGMRVGDDDGKSNIPIEISERVSECS